MRFVLKTLGQIRQLRGRCPACNSEGPQVHGCGVCMGYEGPFPVSESTQRRWAGRFEGHAGAAMHAPRASATLSPVR